MWLSTGTLPILLLLSFVSLALSQSITTDLFYWPLSAPKPALLARIAYDPTSLKPELLSYTPPPVSEDLPDNQIVRVGLYTSTPASPNQWVGSLTSLAALREHDAPILQLHLGPSKEVYHVSVMSANVSTTSPSSSSPIVELVGPETGPRPHLNRPVVVGPDGANPDEPVEKTFFQKYVDLYTRLVRWRRCAYCLCQVLVDYPHRDVPGYVWWRRGTVIADGLKSFLIMVDFYMEVLKLRSPPLGIIQRIPVWLQGSVQSCPRRVVVDPCGLHYNSVKAADVGYNELSNICLDHANAVIAIN